MLPRGQEPEQALVQAGQLGQAQGPELVQGPVGLPLAWLRVVRAWPPVHFVPGR